MAEPATDTRAAYWRKNLRITAALLFVWFVVTFGRPSSSANGSMAWWKT